MPRTKGSKNRLKTNITKVYSSQIVEKQETVASLNTEIVLKKLLASGMSADEILEKLK